MSTDTLDSPTFTLLPHHWRELHQGSGLTLETITAAGIYSESNHPKLAALLNRKRWKRDLGSALVFPYHDTSGATILYRVKPDRPGEGGKYLAPTGSALRAYIPAAVRPFLESAPQPLLITEGEKKTLAATQAGFPTIGLAGVECWHTKKSTALIPDLEHVAWNRRQVFIVFDSDAAGNQSVKSAESLLAAALEIRGAIVRIVRLPPGPQNGDGAGKVGLDDYLVAHGADAFRRLLASAIEPEKPDPADLKIEAGKLDPATVAGDFLKTTEEAGLFRLRFWRGTFHFWQRGAYREQGSPEVRASLIGYVNEFASRVTTSTVNNFLDQVRAQAILPGRYDPPAWLSERSADDWPPDEVLVCRNGLVHLPSLVSGKRPYLVPPTPRFFSTSALDFDFSCSEAPSPENWYRFLGQLWPDDPESVATLQEWFAYCLTPDTRLQKILLLVGPGRSGKGTIGRVLRGLVGEANVCGPTLASLGSQFGLWPFLGKSLAIISDARLGGRADQAAIVERLLSISGEDALTVDRKNLEPVTTKLKTRIMLLSNELPRLQDSSGVFSSRFIILRLRESFLGREDPDLTKKLLPELPAILLWSIEGWQRLQQRRRFTQPESALELVGQLADLTSPVSAFVRDCCRVGPAYRVSVDDLFAGWKEWCEKNGRREPGTIQTFGRNLLAAVPTLRQSRPREEGGRYRAYEGIGLVLTW